MITGQLSKPLLSFRSEMNAELRGEDKAATSDNELNESLLAPAEPNDSEDTPSKLFGKSVEMFNLMVYFTGLIAVVVETSLGLRKSNANL